jgi:hypothetical protein
MKKYCSGCKLNKNLNKFYKNISTKDSLSTWCKNCKRKYNKEHQKIYQKNDHWKEYRKKYFKNKKEKDPSFKLSSNIRIRIYTALKNNSKSNKTKRLLGCSIKQLKQYLESKFTEGMNWGNYGLYGWHIDHIIPCSSFNLSKPEEQRKCFNYKNLQPLWAIDNIKKSNKIKI